VKTGGDNFANGDVLLVRDYEAILCQVDQIVEEVDRRPLQVAIEAVILTVNLDDSMKIGVNFELLRDNRNMRIISGTPITGGIGDTLADIDVSEGGLKIGFLDSSLSALVEALETVGNTNVVASPKVMCLNKQRAEVHIGEELGYVTTTVTETAATQTVEFLEVGTQLRIRPFISSDGMIRMEVHPELSTGTLRPVQDMTVPDKEVTQVTSNIMCRDGHTVVIGGLIREQLVSNATQIPLFGSLPLLGPAFRQKTEEVTRDEIIVLITPQIVHDPFMYAEGEEAMRHTRDRVEVFADKMSPIGTRYYGRRYCRKAQAAWAAGDVDTALRYVNLSIHFDRQNTDALRLRREIVSVCPQPDNNIDARLRQGLMPWQHPHVEYSRSGWPSRTPEPAPGGEQIMQIEEVPAPVPVAVGRVTDNNPAENQTPRDSTSAPADELEMDLTPLPDED
jgi:type IV pilus assembly protein PilQ